MANAVNAWKRDTEGLYIVMAPGGKKDFSIDWTDFLGTDTLASAVWTVPAGVTKVSDELNGLTSKITLQITGDAGVYPCSIQMTSGAGVVEPVHFRVFVE